MNLVAFSVDMESRYDMSTVSLTQKAAWGKGLPSVLWRMPKGGSWRRASSPPGEATEGQWGILRILWGSGSAHTQCHFPQPLCEPTAGRMCYWVALAKVKPMDAKNFLSNGGWGTQKHGQAWKDFIFVPLSLCWEMNGPLKNSCPHLQNLSMFCCTAKVN